MAARRTLLPLLVLLVLAVAPWLNFRAFVFSGVGRHSIVGRTGHRQVESTMLRANGESEGEATYRATGGYEVDKIELGGLSGLVVGLSLLPYVLNTLAVCSGILFSGGASEVGPMWPSFSTIGSYGLTIVSVLITVGTTSWSVGSFFERGKGLPAGPLGFLGLAEGLSYIGTLGVLLATVLVSVRAPPAPTGVPPPAATVTQQAPMTPAVPAPSKPAVQATALPAVQAPAMPAIQAPAIKLPDVKLPDFQVPGLPKQEEPKKEEAKKEEPKKPEAKKEEPKKPEAKKEEPKKEEPKKPEAKKEEPKKEEPKKPEAKKEEPKKEEPKKPEPKQEEPKKPEPKKEEPKKPEPKKEEPKKPEVKAPEPKKEDAKKPAATPDYDSLFD